MKILITGGAGFIGSHIATEYIRMGHQVVIMDDLSRGHPDNLPPEAHFYKVSLTEKKIDEIFSKEKPDVVNHHASQINVRKSVADPITDATVNIIGTLSLLESCQKFHVKKIIFASTGGAIYGEQHYFPADEKHPMEPRSPYGITKLTVEKYLQFFHWHYRIPFVALRYANVYGPRQSTEGEAGVVAIFTKQLLKKMPPTIFGDGNQTRDYVYIDDVVSCNVEALNANVYGIFNVGTGIETNVNEIAKALIELTGNHLVPQYATEKPGEQKRSCLKPGALQKFPSTPLNIGLKKTLEWFSC